MAGDVATAIFDPDERDVAALDATRAEHFEHL
jgi:hypothetical protein